jgi:hypothetical protein
MPIAIRNDDKAQKIQQKILGKPQSANPPSKGSKIAAKSQKKLYVKYQR